jgi:hypothetical protein
MQNSTIKGIKNIRMKHKYYLVTDMCKRESLTPL